jgi:hypothetical protein
VGREDVFKGVHADEEGVVRGLARRAKDVGDVSVERIADDFVGAAGVGSEEFGFAREAERAGAKAGEVSAIAAADIEHGLGGRSWDGVEEPSQLSREGHAASIAPLSDQNARNTD